MILQALDRARTAAPPAGPGWSVCFKDAQDQSITSFSVQSYAQLQKLADEVSALGYTLTVLDQQASDHDFVFREVAAGTAPVLAQGGTLRPPRPDLPAGRRAIAKGDLVMEDCGGPIMLVNALSTDLAYCVWFSEAAAVQSGTFSVHRLVNVGSAKRRLHDASATTATELKLTKELPSK